MSVWSKLTGAWRAAFGPSLERDRLANTIVETRTEFQSSPVGVANTPWAQAVDGYLVKADDCLRCNNLQSGWVTVQMAQRTLLARSNDFARANRVAIVLQCELEKISGWRSRAISNLICDQQGNLQTIKDEEGILRLVDALSLRDDYSNNSYFKILLRRRHLVMLFAILVLGVSLSLFVWPVDFLPNPPDEKTWRFLIVLSGFLGAGISIAQNLLSTDISAKIPAQQIGSFLVWMRPAIGASAALLAIALIGAGEKLNVFNGTLIKNTGAIIAIAFAAGFSERFITQAIEKISKPSDNA